MSPSKFVMKISVVMLSLAMLWVCSAPEALNERLTTTASTTSVITSEVGPREVLETYLTALHEGRYEEAVTLYGGAYETLQGLNPSVDREDYSGLFANACEFNGYQCLTVHSITLEETVSLTEYILLVEFIDSTGELFRFTPPPGSPNEPRTQFSFTCSKTG